MRNSIVLFLLLCYNLLAADTKLTDLAEATSVASNDWTYVVQGGLSKKVPVGVVIPWRTGVDGSASITNADIALNISGKQVHVFTETEYTNSRPVAVSMSFQGSPTSEPVGGFDWHGLDLTGWTSATNITTLCRLYPFETTAKYFGGATLGMAVPIYSQTINYWGGGIDVVKSHRMLVQNLSTGYVGDVHGDYFENPVNSGGGTVSNVFAFSNFSTL